MSGDISGEHAKLDPVKFGIRGKIAVLVGTLVIVTALAITLWIFQEFNKELIARKIDVLSAETKVQGLSFKTSIQELKEDVAFLEGTPPIQGIIRSRTAGGIDPLDNSTEQEWRQRLTTIFTKLLQAKPDYIQIRYIGIESNGREIIRVDRHGENNVIRSISNEELQEKGNTEYFQKAIKNPAGIVSLSDFNLNREYGEISLPPIPVLRASIPVYGSGSGELFGIVVINQDMRTILSDLARVSDKEHVYFIVNQDGDYLLHPDEKKTFRFEYGEPVRFQADFPEFADTYKREMELEETVIHENSDGMAKIVSLRKINYDPSDPSRLLGIMVSDDLDDVTEIANTVRHQAYVIIGVLIICALLIGLFFAQGLSKPILEITRAVRQFARGKEEVSLPVTSKGEAGVLARAFDTMIEEVRDRSQRLQQEVIERQKAEHYAKAIVDYASDAIITIDTKGLILSFNLAAEKLFGYREEEVLGKNVNLLMPSPYREEHDGYIEHYLQTGEKKIIGIGREVIALHKDGREIQIELTVAEVKVGEHHIFTGSIRDITERKRIQDKLAYYAHYDSLTGLPNRTLFRERLGRALVRAHRNNSLFALMFVDLDGFKEVNDALGHDVGDILLVEVAGRFEKCVRESDTVARFGGDEFTFILEAITGKDDPRIVAQKLIGALTTDIEINGHSIVISASIGITLYPTDGISEVNLLKNADIAMYKAKERGNNQYQFYQPGMKPKA